MDGGKVGMSAGAKLTNGGRDGMSGRRRIWIVSFGIIAAVVLLDTAVNATSDIDEFRHFGRNIAEWKPWVWEISSAVAWFMAMPLMVLAALRLRPPRLSWPATILTHLALTVPISLLHVGLMVAMRKAAHGFVGETYRLGADLPSALLYEWRKDALDYLVLTLLFSLIDWVARRTSQPAAAPATEIEGPSRLAVRDGNRTTWLVPADILWAEAAGNYVELHTVAGALLHRTTLAALERELAPHGFARIHRSRLVRRAAVRSVETNASGDFEMVLDDGTRVGGSRRYRAALDA